MKTFFTGLAATLALASAAPQVNVTLYSESLCPDCIHFITGAWYTVWNTKGVGYGTTQGDGQGIIAWNQVVWGNAKLAPDNTTITCQHGSEECLYNTLQACSIKHSNGPAQWLPFIHCLETHAEAGTLTKAAAQKCATSATLDWATLNTCWTGDEGQGLDVDSYYATASLNPSHTFVPWVTLSSEAGAGTFCSDSNCDTFLSAVCDAYTGTKPAGCNGASAKTAHKAHGAVRGASKGCPAEW